jgi:U3 small nucleolar RNA-associated protein 21
LQLLQESQISFLCHPATYVNKFVIGFENGQLELWNIRTKTLVYTFTAHRAHFTKAAALDNAKAVIKFPAVTFIEQSPACDVCAVGFSSGEP